MHTIVPFLVKHGYSALFASVFARQLCLPVPAILFLIAAGALANFFGFSALDVNGRLQATFGFVGKGQQRKRHDKPRHRQPESAAGGNMPSLQACHYHQDPCPFLVRLKQ
jgi:hypothetical protein